MTLRGVEPEPAGVVLEPPGASCVSCGAPVAGAYCAQCGEKQVEARDLTLRGFLRHALETFASFDSRALRSLRLLLTRPGLLTAEYVDGRRRPYLSPLQLFLIANVLFFFASGFLPVVTLDSPLDVHLYSSFYSEQARDLVRDRFARADTVDFVRFKTRFDYAAQQLAKTLVIVFVPLFALAIALLRVLRREPAGKHLAFALHFMAFALLAFVGMGVLILLVRVASGERLLQGDSGAIVAVALLSLMAYLVPAFRRAYRSGRAAALVQGIVVALLFIPVLMLYRLLLFFAVFYSV